MTPKDHDDYAADLLSSLRGDGPEVEVLNFVPNAKQSRNAAGAMTAILCHRLFRNSSHRRMRKTGTTYEWKQGTFNCRNIADREYLWTNMRRGVADEMHDMAKVGPAAYLLACCEPEDTTLNTWAIPEPLLHDSLASLIFEEAGQKYTVQVRTDKQRIERYAASPDLTPYYRRFQLEQNEMLLLKESREVDASVKDTRKLLIATEQRLNKAGVFNPEGVADARERVLSSIVRRRGQAAFRRRLLAAYRGRCAITGCNAVDVLEAAHILSYKGPETNHPANGLLLRTDLHTLFDLRLIAVDVETMTVLVSPRLSATCYWEYRGRPLRVPKNHEDQPSREALEQHRQESRL